MAIAKKSELKDARLKILIWGSPGSGKSRFALSAPKPLVIDLEGGTRLYSNEYNFYIAEVDTGSENTANCCTLAYSIADEIIAGEYPDVETLIIDPVTDLLEALERYSARNYEKIIGKDVMELNAIQKTKWYAYRRDKARAVLDKLKNLPVNLILVARSKLQWGNGSDGKMIATGETYDALPIVESLMDVVINLKKDGNEKYSAEVKKSRIGNLPRILEINDYNSIVSALNVGETKKTAAIKMEG